MDLAVQVAVGRDPLAQAAHAQDVVGDLDPERLARVHPAVELAHVREDGRRGSAAAFDQVSSSTSASADRPGSSSAAKPASARARSAGVDQLDHLQGADREPGGRGARRVAEVGCDHGQEAGASARGAPAPPRARRRARPRSLGPGRARCRATRPEPRPRAPAPARRPRRRAPPRGQVGGVGAELDVLPERPVGSTGAAGSLPVLRGQAALGEQRAQLQQSRVGRQGEEALGAPPARRRPASPRSARRPRSRPSASRRT